MYLLKSWYLYIMVVISWNIKHSEIYFPRS